MSLEVQYKSKIAAGSTVLCTTEVESMEGRKLWMKATVSGERLRQGGAGRGGWAGVRVRAGWGCVWVQMSWGEEGT